MYWIIGGLATIVCAALIVLCIQNVSVPELGVDNGQFKPLAPKPNGVSTQARDESKRVAPLALKAGEHAIMPAIKTLIADMPGAEVKQSTDHYLYAVFSSPAVGFKDDVEVYIDAAAALVHFRSASRAGYSDLGVNRKRYQSFVERIKAFTKLD